jgi:endonuclease/exonuclease/phosphatase family metal-dependent hydrolase
MHNFIQCNLKRVATVYFILFAFIVIVVSVLPWWPFYQWLIIPKYILLFGPRWWLVLLSLLVLIFFPYFSKGKKWLLAILFVGVFNYLDFQFPPLENYFLPRIKSDNSIKIINANIGGGASIYEIQLLIEDEEPDILLLQEANNINSASWGFSEYRVRCKGGLCIISKLDFEEVGELSRKLIDGWGNFAMLYKVNTLQGSFSLANIHLETPRTVIMGVLHAVWDQSSAKKIESNRQYQALLISSWQQSQARTIIAGDFNMLEDENIYRQYFSAMGNAIDSAGVGFNYTKKTSWHGARIDHLLFSDGFVLVDVKVIDSLMGDHKPVVSTLYQIH